MIHRITFIKEGLNNIGGSGEQLIDALNQHASQIHHTSVSTLQEHAYPTLQFPSEIDTTIQSANGEYMFAYAKLGKIGYLIKNGEVIREVKRDDYQHATYEYPVTFLAYKGCTYLIHCPLEYCRLDIEDVVSGRLISDIKDRKPSDVFHSRLQLNTHQTQLLSKGWLWHPWDIIQTFDISACFLNPHLLDKAPYLQSNFGTEISDACFLDSERILLLSSAEQPLDDELIPPLPPLHLAIWDLRTQQVQYCVSCKGHYGHLFAISEDFVWDIFEFPKIVHIKTGKIFAQETTIYTGKQASSIIGYLEKSERVQVMQHPSTKQLAILTQDTIELLTPDLAELSQFKHSLT